MTSQTGDTFQATSRHVDGPKVVDEVSLGQSDATVNDGNGLCIRIVVDLDLEVIGVAKEGIILHSVDELRVSGVDVQPTLQGHFIFEIHLLSALKLWRHGP